jgi:hypothetical protein
MRDRNLLLISIAILATCTAIAVAAFRNQAQKDVGGQVAADHNSWPLTDYSAPRPIDPEKRALREARGKKYAKSMFRVHPEDPSENTAIVDTVDRSLPALPVMRSNLVVLGDVLAANAYLSNDQTGIYSEFSIRVEDVLKNEDLEPLTNGCLIDIEREGGRVRFPSGRIHWYSVDKENMPLVGRRYVFFLTRGSQEEAFHILTAYELRGGKVVVLDELPQFKSQAGKNEGDFVNAVRTLVNTSS